VKLRRPPYPDPIGTAGYYWVHAGHRETAISHATEVVRDTSKRELEGMAHDPIMVALSAPMGAWVVESRIQGAWMREYHEWEKATKAYFDGHHVRNGSTKVDWKTRLSGSTGAASHVDRVRAQLALFSASVLPDTLDAIDRHRCLINTNKHEDDYFATEEDYRDLVQAIAAFWNELAPQEEFTLKRMG